MLVGTATLGAASTTVARLNVCGGAAEVRPSYVLLGCGDGGQFLTRVRWSSWTNHQALATSVWWQNLCNPDCAAGHFRHERTTVRLFRPRFCRAPPRMLFTRMTLAVPHAALVKVTVPYFSPSRCP